MLRQDMNYYREKRKQGWSMLNYRQAITGVILEDIKQLLKITSVKDLEELAEGVLNGEAVVSLDVEWELSLLRDIQERRN